MKIDAVIIWVDGSDARWLKKFKKYRPIKDSDKTSAPKFRDWDTLKYIFRGIESFMPWVNTIHFVTFGHLPHWMNVSSPKLHIVTHDEIFADKSLLPVFSSSSIELNIKNIKGLTEQFVYFNDDTLVLQPTKKERLFVDGKPRDFLIQTMPRRGWIYYTFFSNVAWRYNINNNVKLINSYFNKKDSIKKCRSCYYNKVYGFLGNLKNIVSNLFANYHYFEHYHQVQPSLKSVWEEASNVYREEIESTISHKFRDKSDITAYLFRYWHLVSGNFVPHFEKDFIIQNLKSIENIQEISQMLLEDKYRFVCLNDESFEMDDDEFLEGKRILSMTLDKVLQSKSSYER